MKKDDFLQNLMMVPPKQRMQIEEFSVATQQQAFAMSMEGLKGVRTSSLHTRSLDHPTSPLVEYPCISRRVLAGTRRPEETGMFPFKLLASSDLLLMRPR